MAQITWDLYRRDSHPARHTQYRPGTVCQEALSETEPAQCSILPAVWGGAHMRNFGTGAAPVCTSHQLENISHGRVSDNLRNILRVGLAEGMAAYAQLP